MLNVFMYNRYYTIHWLIGIYMMRSKTVELDCWSLEEMYGINSIGNIVANLYWEGNFVSPC